MVKLPRFEGLRARAATALDKLPGKAGELARRANDALGRPLADAAELADRRAFADGTTPPAAAAPAKAAAADPGAPREVAPVIIYYMDKTSRDVQRVADILDVAGIAYKKMNIEQDPAAQSAIRRDSKGARLPVVFVAGECIGGRAELVNLSMSGELAKIVFGS